eukprot:5323495-Pleurochrysis_carterae.AAC.4
MEAKYQHFLTLIEAGEAAALKEALEKATFEAGEELKLLSHADHNGRTLLHSAASGEGESLEALLNAFSAIDVSKSPPQESRAGRHLRKIHRSSFYMMASLLYQSDSAHRGCCE